MIRKCFAMALALCVLCASLCLARAQRTGWTVLVYLCGTDLESNSGQASEDLREMLASGAGASGGVRVLAATGGTSKWKRYDIAPDRVQYYDVQGSAPRLLSDAGPKSMGSADTLADFLRFGVQNAPAEHYALILWDHGGGPVYGLCRDDNHAGDALSLSELDEALKRGLGGAKLDLLAFDACLMNSVDTCALAADYADYVVASQEMVTGKGLDYDGWLAPLAATPAMDAETLAALMARTYVQSCAAGRHTDTATMSVIRSDRMAGVSAAADAFGAALAPLLRDQLSSVVRLRSRLNSFGEFINEDASDLVDIQNLCDAFSPLLGEESAALKRAAREAVVCNETTADIAGQANGLSLFMPYSTARNEYAAIMGEYNGQKGSYASMVTAMTESLASGGYSMLATTQAADNFYSVDDAGESGGLLCSIWNALYGDTVTADTIAQSSGGIWAGLSTASDIWAGLPAAAPSTAAPGGIWAGLPTASPDAQPAPAQASTVALDSIWSGLLNDGDAYYQSGEDNANVQPGISDAIAPDAVIAAAQSYFSTATLTTQSVYTLQLTREDLDHLASASGVLFQRESDGLARLGDIGATTIDWSTGMIYSMFDGAWPTLGGAPVRAERLYVQEDGSVRFVVPAKVNGLEMYLLVSRSAEGDTQVLGATQGYDEDGMAIRGSIPLEAGMTVVPMYAVTRDDGSEIAREGAAVTVPEDGLALQWEALPAGDYEYRLGLTDLSGDVQYTQAVALAV